MIAYEYMLRANRAKAMQFRSWSTSILGEQILLPDFVYGDYTS
jgi:hypothetical protein